MNNIISSIADLNGQADPVLSCQQLSKGYVDGPTHVEVLRHVNLDLYRGEMLAIVGRSGSGKSTLLHLLGGLDQPSSGQVLLQGQNYQQLSETQRCYLRNQSLGFVYQFHHLLPELTALENIGMPLLLRGVSPALVRAKAEDLLHAVGLHHRARHRPAALSGGERQRVAIARALVGNPACVLADEPTGNLDADNAKNILVLFVKLQQHYGLSVIVVTHDVQLAKQVGRVMHLVDGKLKLHEA